MPIQNRLKQIFLFILFIICFVLFIVGRKFDVTNDLLNYILGSYPNFQAAFFFPLLLVFELAKKFGINRTELLFHLSLVFVIILLIIEEYVPIFGNSKIWDIHDILFSSVGSIFALLYFHFYLKHRIAYAKE